MQVEHSYKDFVTGQGCLLMMLCRGSVKDLLAKERYVDLPRAAKWGFQLANALTAIHVSRFSSVHLPAINVW